MVMQPLNTVFDPRRDDPLDATKIAFEAAVTSNAREGMANRQKLARRKGIPRASELAGSQFERGGPHRP